MNNKENFLRRIVEAVVSCCATDVGDGKMSLTAEDVLGVSRRENVVMTRAILCAQVIGAGYSTATVAQLLGKTTKAIRHLLELHYDYLKTSRAYRIADAEATLMCRDLEEE